MIFGIISHDLKVRFLNFIGLNKNNSMLRYIRVILTFSLVCFAWIFFRAKNIQDALYISGHLFSGAGGFFLNLLSNIGKMGKGKGILEQVDLGQGFEFSIAICSIVFLLFVHLIQRHGSIRHMLSAKPAWLRWGCYCFMLITMLLFGYFESPKQFIYFQF